MPDLTLAEIGEALIHSDTIFHPLLKSYILHPKFIDYPLIGLSKRQIMEMQKWMNDRYNENLLIDVKYLSFNTHQKDEDCYVIEAALVGQYEGTSGKYRYRNDYDDIVLAVEKWQKHPHKPNFRLPYTEELIEIGKGIELDNRLREYSFGKKDFLWKWKDAHIDIYKYKGQIHFGAFLEYYNDDYYKNNPFYQDFSIHLNEEYQLPKEPMTNLTLKENEQQFNNIAYLKDEHGGEYFYPEKDSTGRMGFVIVGADEENRPLVADRIQASNEPINNAIYRIVYNKTIDSSYLPR